MPHCPKCGGVMKPDIVFYGDYLATAPQTELAEALRGVRPEREAVREVFDRFDIPALFGGIREEEILELMVGNQGDKTENRPLSETIKFPEQ